MPVHIRAPTGGPPEAGQDGVREVREASRATIRSMNVLRERTVGKPERDERANMRCSAEGARDLCTVAEFAGLSCGVQSTTVAAVSCHRNSE